MSKNPLDLAARLNRISADLAALPATEENLGAIKDLCVEGFQSIAESITDSMVGQGGQAPAPQQEEQRKQAGE